MNSLADVLDKLAAVPRTQRLALYAMLGVAILALFWTLLISGTLAEISTLEGQVAEAAKKRDEVERRAVEKEKSEAELAMLTETLGKALKELPASSEIPELLKRITQEGRKAGLEIPKFQPLPEIMMQYYAEIPVAIELYGSYHEVALFFDALSRLGRIVSVQDIQMKAPEEIGGKTYLVVTGKTVTYRFLSDEEIKKQSEAAAARGKKGKK